MELMKIDPKKLEQVADKADYVIEEPTAKQIVKYLDVGDRISYVGKDKSYRPSAFIMAIHDNGNTFAVYGGTLRWSVRTENVDRIFIFKKVQDE